MEIRARGEPQFFDWTDDGGEAAMHWQVDEIRIIPSGEPDKIRIVFEGERAAWFWAWGNIDVGLQQEAMEALYEGTPSPLLEQVREAFERYVQKER